MKTTKESILIAYEDDYCDELHRLIKTLRRDIGHPGIILEARPVKGTGNFVTEVPRYLRNPLSQTKCPPNRVICVGDADRPQNLVPGALLPPPDADGAALDRWVADFEDRWRQYLISKSNLSKEQESSLHVLGLRWNKESLLISCPAALLAHAGIYRQEVETLLNGCVPAPATLADGEFVVRYRKPAECLNEIFKTTSESTRRYKKGRDDEDLLRDEIIAHHARRTEVMNRSPDLRRLLSLLVF